MYGLIQHGLTTFIGLVFLLNITQLAVVQQLLVIAWVVYASVAVGEILSLKLLGWWLEIVKYLFVFAAVMTQPVPMWLNLTLVAFALVSAMMWPSLRKEHVHHAKPEKNEENIAITS